MALQIVPEWVPVPNSLTVYGVLAIALTVGIMAALRRRRFVKAVDRVPGIPGGLTVLGNTLMILVSPDGLYIKCI